LDKQYSLALKIILTVFLIGGLIWFFTEILWVISLVLISALVVYSISPGVTFLTERKFPHWLSVILVYLVFLALLVLVFYLLIPIIIDEIVELTQLLPRYINLLQPMVEDFLKMAQSPQFEELLTTLIQQAPANLQQVLNQVTAITFALFYRLSELVIILFLVFYLLKDLNKIKVGVARAVPYPYRYEFVRVLNVLDEKVGAYLRGNLLRCSVVGLLTGTGLLILGMPFYFVLGVSAGLLNIIYYIGPYIAGIPAVLISLSPDTPGVLVIIIFYVLVQTIDAFLLTPLLLGKAVDIRPFTIIVSILIGGKLLGVLGIILAIPFAATLKVVFSYYSPNGPEINDINSLKKGLRKNS